jgi:hypothetical protein
LFSLAIPPIFVLAYKKDCQEIASFFMSLKLFHKK